VMLISQFMGRLGRANRGNKTLQIQKKTSEGEQHTGEFSLIQFYSTQTFVQEVFNISVFKTRLFTSLSSSSPVRVTLAY
jgi:hypothetical protein